MEVRTSLRKALGVAISAATLLAFMPLGASMANAADETVSDPSHVEMTDKDNVADLTINDADTAAVKGHKFAALRIGTYDLAAKTEDTPAKIKALAVGTVNDSTISSAVETAYTGAGGKVAKEYEGNPTGALASTMLGFEVSPVDPETNNLDTTSNNRKDHAYKGDLRTFAEAIAGFNGSLKTQIAASPYTAIADANATSIKFTGLPQGLYIVKDVSQTVPSGSQLSIPMIVGTGVYVKDDESNPIRHFSNNSGIELGVVNVKNDQTTLHKEMLDDTLGVGDWGTFRLSTRVPMTTSFTNYIFKITDNPSEGYTLPVETDPEYNEVKVYVKQNATDTDNDTTDTAKGKTKNLIDGQYYKATWDKDAHSLTVDFKNSLISAATIFPMDSTIDITYKLKRNDSENAPSNTATLTHSTTPGWTPSPSDPGPEPTVDIPSNTVKLHTFGFKLKNFLRGKSSFMLTGTKFTVSRVKNAGQQDETVEAPMAFYGVDGKGAYSTTNDHNASKTDLEVSNQTDDTKGTVSIDGLGLGTYEVKQTTASTSPNLRGVMLPKFRVTLTGSGDPVDGTVAADTVTVKADAWKLVEGGAVTDGYVKVSNVPSVIQLPLTGGAGIVLAVIVILALAALFGGTAVLKRRHETTRRHA